VVQVAPPSPVRARRGCVSASAALVSAVLYLLYGFYVRRSILIPVRQVAATARRMAAGDRAAMKPTAPR